MNITHLDDLVYDYTQIADPNTRTLAQRAADDIKPRLRRAADDILVIGQRLAVVRQYLPHGQWMDWLTAEFEMSDDAARRFIHIATRFSDKFRNLRDLKPSALYMLAAPSTPDDAITQVETLITNGHTPTVAETKQIITTARAGLVPAPVAPAPGKPLMQVMTTAEERDIASRLAAADEATAYIQADTISQQTRWGALAAAWLRNHRDNAGRVWSDLTDNQILHANAPWHQSFIREVVREYPEMPDVKAALSEGLSILRLHRAANPTPHTQSPNHPITPPSPTDNKALSPETPRDRRIAQAQSLPATTYNVVLADPPWQYNNTGVNGAAANHYNTMSFSQLSALPDQIGLDIAPNAVLFLWATNPMLADALDLAHNWGFTYKTNMVWVKDRVGTGFYVRGMHELLLICTKGAMTPINPNSTPPITSVINAPTQEHSRKPDQVHQLIEQLYPDCNYIELFARRQRAGWDVWGNEVNQ